MRKESDKGEERCEVYQSGWGGLSNESSGEIKGAGKKETEPVIMYTRLGFVSTWEIALTFFYQPWLTY